MKEQEETMENIREVVKNAYKDMALSEEELGELKRLLKDVLYNIKKETTSNKK